MEHIKLQKQKEVKIMTNQLAMEICCALEEFFEGKFTLNQNQITFTLDNGQTFLFEIKQK